MRVRMVPHVDEVGTSVSGIMTVVGAYFKHLPEFGVELVGKDDDDFDVFAVHAGMSDRVPQNAPLVAHLHGLYWSSDFAVTGWEMKANRNVIDSARHAKIITVPSEWVAETIRRDLRVNPFIVPHGIDWQDWQHTEECDGYVLGYAKNRAYQDVCDPTYLTDMARKHPKIDFLATFAPPDAPPNVRVIGLQTPEKMKRIIQRAACVISPIKETFGVLTLEAMASGVPVLGYAYGGNLELIRHLQTGYLAKPNDRVELGAGLMYCLEHHKTLGENAQEIVKQYTWEKVCQDLTAIYQKALEPEPPTVAVIIPSYNYAKKVGKAIESVQSQTYTHITNIVIVDDGSTDSDETSQVIAGYAESDARVRYIRQDNAGVACARNRGIGSVSTKYILCLDADDRIERQFIEACVRELEKDRSLGIAYTGLMRHYPDGREEPSDWPHPFDPDAQFRRQNQIPTACVFRREVWQRVGGYRQRYAPTGCGSEDADFWTRVLSYGWGAKMATEAPLFIYSVGTGYVSGNKAYREVDWLALAPWAEDGQHPFASAATPKRMSHPVRQYDEPTISVIIPVGSGHKSKVFNALDSLEGQSFRKWEVVLVDDTGDPDEKWEFDGNPDGLAGYPYVKLIATSGKRGAGYARNRGVEASHAPLLLFLDADDNLFGNHALDLLLDAYVKAQAVIYSDYVGKAVVDKPEREKLKKAAKLLDDSLFDKTGLVMYRGNAAEFDCERAIRQPAPPEYIWNLITSLVPRMWHDEIGGFDEHMPSWEDWDYWIRIARCGHCFVRIAEPLVAYRFYTGTRRETGIQVHQNLIQYLLEKYDKEAKPMACGCSKKNTMNASAQPGSQARAEAQGATMTDEDFILVTYEHPNRGMHRVIGHAPFATAIAPGMVRTPNGFTFQYGYHGGGEEFYVHRADVERQPHIFRPVPAPAPAPVAAPAAPPPAPEPEPAREPVFDPQLIPGVTRAIATIFEGMHLDSLEAIIELGEAGLAEIEGISERRAKTILAAAAKIKGSKAEPVTK